MNEVFWQCVASVTNSLCLATFVPDGGDSDRVWNRNLFHLHRADCLRKLQCMQFIINIHLTHLLKYVVLCCFLLFCFSEFSV